MEQNTQKAKTAALLEAFGCALAYLLAGKLLATVLPAPAGDARALSFARHCVLAPVAEELVFRGAAAHILYDDALDPSCLDVCKHTLEARTVEVRAGVTVVLVIMAVGSDPMILAVAFKNLLLVRNGVTFTVQLIFL